MNGREAKIADLRIGPYRAHAVENTTFRLDGGAMYGSIPRTLWERSDPPNERNRILMHSRSLLLVSDERRVLIDCGLGDKWDDKLTGIYEIDNHTTNTEGSLAALGLTPEDITHVILTHLHFDHAGGSTRVRNGDLAATFPNATYFVQERNLAWAKNPCDKDAASFFTRDFLPLEQSGQLQTVRGETEILPGIRVLVFQGHTEAMQCPVVSADGRTLFYCADLIPLMSHIRYPYIMGYDLRPLETLAEKKRILEKAMAENWVLFFEHENSASAITVRPGDRFCEVAERFPSF